MRRHCTHNPTSGKFSSNKNTLPTYRLATTPQNKSGRCVINMGPGCTPCITKAPSSKAVTALPGMPRVNKGIIPPDTAALLAASGPATPSIAPLPKRSGSLAIRRSSVYDTNEAVTGPPPGTSPRKNPKKLPRIMGFQEAFQSAKVGQRPLIFSASI